MFLYRYHKIFHGSIRTDVKIRIFPILIACWSGFKIFKQNLQWGTKVLRLFFKMTPFWTVNIPIPSPCVPPPLPLKPKFYFRPSSLSFTINNIDSGMGGFTAFKQNEIINEWNFRQVWQIILSLMVACERPLASKRKSGRETSLSCPGVSISTNSQQNLWATLLIKVASFFQKKKQQLVWIML